MPSTADNPFLDPSVVAEENTHDVSFAIDSTLAVGRDATLTMGTDALIVLGMAPSPFISAPFMFKKGLFANSMRVDEDFEKDSTANCCGLITSIYTFPESTWFRRWS